MILYLIQISVLRDPELHQHLVVLSAGAITWASSVIGWHNPIHISKVEMRHVLIIWMHIDHFRFFFRLGIWQIVVCISVISPRDNVWVVDHWLSIADLLKLIESSKQENSNGENNHWNDVVDIAFMIKESDLISRNSLAHVLQIHHE